MAPAFSDLDLSHHAYVIVGGAAEREALMRALAKDHKIRTTGNPDLYDRRYETFAVNDARALKALAETRPVVEGGRKIFMLLMDGITIEAQNALLKLLEEPGEYAHFFLIVPSAHLLIATVKSRIRFLGPSAAKTGGAAGSGAAAKEGASAAGRYDIYVITLAKRFLAAPTKARFDIVKELMDDIAKEKRTKQDAIDFLNALEESLHSQGVKKSRAGLEAVLLAGKYATDRAPSLKMLLEYVALTA